MFLLAFFHEVKNTLLYLLLTLIASYYLYTLHQPFVPKTISNDKNNTLKLIQYNLNFQNQRMDDVVEYLKNSSADVITLQEVTPEHQAKLEEMKEESYLIEFSERYPYLGWKKGAYPYQRYCEFSSVGAVAILSKYPLNIEKSACLHKQGLLWSEVQVNETTINIVSIHTYWPYPFKQPEQVQTIKPIFTHIQTPSIIAGDFNAVPWSHTVKEIEKASNTKTIEGLRWTIELKDQLPHFPYIKLPIDHVLVSKEFEVERIYVDEDKGSDHFPVVTTLRY
jgi:endonuclease/exonuclease/phosphatase (EEP) superfamily protein YafD